MADQSTDKSERLARLRHEILEKTAQYYELAFGTNSTFVPGEQNIPYAGRVFDAQEMQNAVDASLDFWLTAGRFSKEFETKFAKKLGLKHAMLCNSGSSANLLAFMALTSPLLEDRRIRKGDEVITVAAGFPTTVAPVLQFGAVPVFLDIQTETGNIDVRFLEEAYSEKTRAVMIAHTLGNPFDLDAVTEFCRRHHLWLVEDNCDALGSEYRGQLTGTFGDVATSSFYPPHHITMGEGGAVYTNKSILKRAIESFRDWGRDCWCEPGKDNTCGKRFEWELGTLPKAYDHKYIYRHLGYNLKATDIQAAIGCVQLDKLDRFVGARRKNWQYLYDELKTLEEYFVLPEPTPHANPSWFGFLISIRDNVGFTRSEIVQYLEKHKIQTRMLFGGNLLRQPVFDDFRSAGGRYRTVGDLKNTDRAMSHAFWLGVYPGLTETMLNYVIERIHTFVKNGR
ncbi:lipopolysaccharide biosynthesis protein RfbH [bacterium]|nr:lipopolysaccharide biosynthesis protein RfbH [bacterium]